MVIHVPPIANYKPTRPSHHPTLLRFLPQPSRVTMLTQFHTRVPVEPDSFRYLADRALPDICGQSGTPGDLHGPGQWD